MSSTPVQFPAGYAAGVSIAFVDPAGAAVLASAERPLPVRAARVDPPPPLSGQATGEVRTAGFAAAPGLPLWITLAGGWTGRVRVERSADGVDWRPLTAAGEAWAVFTAPAHEPIGQEERPGALYRLTGQVDGTLTFRVAQ